MTGAYLHHEQPPPTSRRQPVIIAAVIVALAALLAVGAWFVITDDPAMAEADTDTEETTPPAESAEPEPSDTVTISGVGDTIMGMLPDAPLPENGEGYFDQVSQALTGDVVIGNLEGAMSTRTEFEKCAPTDKCIYIRMPPEYAPLLAEAGFTVMNGANNHAYDSGPDGHADTDQALAEAGMEYSGVKGEITEIDVNGTTVAMVGFAPYYYYDNLIDPAVVTQVVSAAAERADLVVASMHLGAEGTDARHVPDGPEEFNGEERGDSIAATHAAVDAGADLVLGHGPHVLRGMEFYNGRIIAHSLGNFAGYGVLATDGALGRGAVLSVELDKSGEWVGGKLVATKMIDGGIPSIDPDNGAYADINELAADFGQAGVSVGEDGTIAIPTS